jgi:hypothetical protein
MAQMGVGAARAPTATAVAMISVRAAGLVAACRKRAPATNPVIMLLVILVQRASANKWIAAKWTGKRQPLVSGVG